MARKGTSIGTGATLVRAFSVGIHTLTAEVTDDDGATTADGVVVTVNPFVPPVASVHIGDLDGAAGANKSAWSATVTVAVQPATTAQRRARWSLGRGAGLQVEPELARLAVAARASCRPATCVSAMPARHSR